jgi:hypothetical protein
MEFIIEDKMIIYNESPTNHWKSNINFILYQQELLQ